MDRLAKGEIKVNVLTTYPLEKIVEAFALTDHLLFGKVVIIP